MARHQTPLGIAKWIELQKAGGQSCDYTQTHEDAPLFKMFLAKQIVGANRRHNERTGDQAAIQGMGSLPPSPEIQHQLPEAGQLERAIGGAFVADWMLHPGIGGDDEETRQPEPNQSSNPVNQCCSLLIRFSANRNSPRKVDSRKKAKMASIARVCPMTPPARREKCDQFVPNWNSIGIPVTTPMTKLILKILAQKRAASSQRSSLVFSARVFRITISGPSP